MLGYNCGDYYCFPLATVSQLGWAQGTGEQTSKFLASDTTAYFSFNPKNANLEAFEDVFLAKAELALVRSFLLGKVEDKWGIDYDEDVEPWLREITAATLYTANSKVFC